MTQDEFVKLLLEELARRGGHFEPDDVRRFVTANRV